LGSYFVPLVFALAGRDGEDAETLIRRVIASQERQQELAREYTYRESVSTKDLDSTGQVRDAESQTYLVTPAPGGEYRRLLAKNGAPLSAKEDAEEERKFQEHVAKQLGRPASDREAETKKKTKERVERYRERLEEALEAFDFVAMPDETLLGEPVRVFRFSPRPGYKGHSRATKILARMEGTVWIDPRRDQLARLHLRIRESLKFLGGIFGRVSEGSEALAAGSLHGGELWLPDRIEVTLDARFYFLKDYHQRITFDYDDYRKYVVATEERVGRGQAP
jgi:hypothetical protein